MFKVVLVKKCKIPLASISADRDELPAAVHQDHGGGGQDPRDLPAPLSPGGRRGEEGGGAAEK